MIPVAPLDAVLSDGRDYVQGTQILARAGEHLLSHGAVALTSAAFHRISTQATSVISAEAFDGEAAHLLGKASFSLADASTIVVVFVEEAARAPIDTRAERCRYELIDQSGDLDARFQLSPVAQAEDFLVGLVQAVKHLHAQLGPTVHDIWFTGLRRTTLPIAARSKRRWWR